MRSFRFWMEVQGLFEGLHTFVPRFLRKYTTSEDDLDLVKGLWTKKANRDGALGLKVNVSLEVEKNLAWRNAVWEKRY